MESWTSRQLALAGAVAGVVFGFAIVQLVEPNGGYGNDAYRSGANVGFVVRYAILGGAGATLAAGFLRRGTEPQTTAGLLRLAGLVAVLALAVIPPLLDSGTRAGGNSSGFRAGAIDGCVASIERQMAAESQRPVFNADAYCTCLIERIAAGPNDDRAELVAVVERMQAGQTPSGRTQEIARACVRLALPH